jgi:hypothetical protein
VSALEFLEEIGAFVLLGLFLGILVTRRPKTFAPAVKPFLALAVRARVLLLPLFAIVAVGAVERDPLWQLLIGVALLLIAWLAILRPEREWFKATLDWQGPIACKVGRHFLAISLVGLPVAIVLGTILSGDTLHFEAIGGPGAVILVFGLGVWLLAFLLRLFSYATSWLRIGVSVAFTLAGLRLAMAAGVLPGDSLLPGWTTAALVGIAFGLLLVEATLYVVAGKREQEPQASGRTWRAVDPVLKVRKASFPLRLTQTAGRWGFSAALLAAIALLGAVVYGLVETAQPGARLSTPDGERVEPELASIPPGEVENDLALARTYAPVLAFTRGERWFPIAVDSYVREARLKGPPGVLTRRRNTLQGLPNSCPGLAASPCYKLTIRCEEGSECSEPPPDRRADRLYRSGAVYYRVERKPDSSAGKPEPAAPAGEQEEHRIGEPANVFIERGPFADELSILLQYWYFYRYDEWETTVFAGQLQQRHEGDWEAVTIGLSEDEPLFVAYSAHCEGTWRHWKDVEVSGMLPRPWTHPLVAIAEGSHANYPKADQKRPPDPASCSKALPAGTSTALSYASNIRDKTEYGWLWYPPERGWRVADPAIPPMSFPGTWGDKDTTTLATYFKEFELGKGPGPRTPSQQSLWEKPVPWIFCERFSGPGDRDGC